MASICGFPAPPLAFGARALDLAEQPDLVVELMSVNSRAWRTTLPVKGRA
jgi:hypothetical protein